MKKITKIISSVVLVLGLVATPLVLVPSAEAETPQAELCKGSGGKWDGTNCTNTNAGGSIEEFIKNIINVLLFAIGAVAVIMIIIGGFKYVVSNGDSSSITSAKNTILYAVVGLVIAIIAYAIVNFVVNRLA